MLNIPIPAPVAIGMTDIGTSGSFFVIFLWIIAILVYLNVGYIIGAKMHDIHEDYEDFPRILLHVLWPVTKVPSDGPVRKCTRSEYALLMSFFWLIHFVWQWFWGFAMVFVGGVGYTAYLIFRTIFQILTLPASWVDK